LELYGYLRGSAGSFPR